MCLHNQGILVVNVVASAGIDANYIFMEKYIVGRCTQWILVVTVIIFISVSIV